MKMNSFEVTIAVSPAGYNKSSGKVLVLVPEGITNSGEILQAIEKAVQVEVERIVEKKAAPK